MSRQAKTNGQMVKNGGAHCDVGYECGETKSNVFVSCSSKSFRRTNFVVEDDEDVQPSRRAAERDEIQDGAHDRTTKNNDEVEADVVQEDEEDVEDCLLDAQKVDEWLKNRSDSLSSIEFDSCEIKQEDQDDYEFEQVSDDPVKIRTATEQLAELFMKARPASPNNNQDGGGGCLDRTSAASSAISICSGGSSSSNRALNGNKCSAKSILRPRKNSVVSPKTIPADTPTTIPVRSTPPVVAGVNSQQAVVDGFAVGLKSLKDIMLMTPQELERMPESGIEFEESVGPKEFEILRKHEQLQDSASTQQIVVSKELDGGVDVVESTSDATAAGVSGDAAAATTQQAGASSTLATISISTDKLTNTTSIVINTKQGQQSFKINTSNLMQAAATLQPITLADLVDQPSGSSTLHIDAPVSVPVANPLVPSPPSLVGVNVKPGKLAGKKKKTASVRMKSLLIPVKPGASTSPVNDVQPIIVNVTENKAPAIVSCLQDDKGATVGVCTHSGRCKKVWKCPEPECNKVFNKQCKLKVHLKTHSNSRPYKCDVDECDWSFASIYKLKRHLETHCSIKDFVCDHDGCNRRFTTIYNLKSHKRLHAQQKSVSCPIDNCDSLFPTRRKMEIHMKDHEGVEAPYKCPVDACNKAYFTTNSMASHLRSHQKATFQCPVEGCEAVLDKMSRFKVHMWRHTGERPYPCTHEGCNWAFSSASKLNRHARKHTGERRYECKEPNCGKSFMRLEHLQGHIVTHSGDKPYACHHKDCDARFTARSSLYVHLKKHDGRAAKSVYPCPITTCSKRYTCKSSLRIHMLRYHSTKLPEENSSQVDYITLLASDGVQDATTTVDEFGQIVDPIARSLSFTNPSLVPDEIQITTVIDSAAASEQSDSPNLPAEQSDLPVPQASSSSADVLTISSNDIHIEATTVIMTSPTSTNAVAMPSTSSDVELLTTRVLQENYSGSARTDYCSNHMLVKRARKHRQLEQEFQISESFPLIDNSGETQPNLADVLAYREALNASIHYIHMPSCLQDSSDLFSEDAIAGELALSMLVDPTTSAQCDMHHQHGPQDFCARSSSAVTEFTNTTINLRDLE